MMVNQILQHFSFLDVEFIQATPSKYYFYLPPIDCQYVRPRVMLVFDRQNTYDIQAVVLNRVAYSKNTALVGHICVGNACSRVEAIKTLFTDTTYGYHHRFGNYEKRIEEAKFAIKELYITEFYFESNGFHGSAKRFIFDDSSTPCIFVENNIILI